jgi:tetratricopeptide (TPR) repeat protein
LVIRLDPKYVLAYFNRAFTWLNKGDLNRAIADYSQAVKIDPKYALAYFNRGVVWKHLGNIDRALADFNEAVKLDPELTHELMSRRDLTQ